MKIFDSLLTLIKKELLLVLALLVWVLLRISLGKLELEERRIQIELGKERKIIIQGINKKDLIRQEEEKTLHTEE